MSWLQKLYETYDRCAGHEPDGAGKLMPISHTTQQAQIEVVLDDAGNIQRARVLDKNESNTLIPCTEESGGRAGSKPVNHPLCDKLQYLAGDFTNYGGIVTSGYASEPKAPHKAYCASLNAWANSEHQHPKLHAIQMYVMKGSLLQDLINHGILHVDTNKLKTVWDGDKETTPPIFKALSNTQTQDDAFVRWSVERAGDPVSGTWQDSDLIHSWISHYRNIQTKRGYCMVMGDETALAVQHPAKLRHGGDKAKLISANDSTGYTFRGKFIDSDEAVGVAFEVTQKAHNALRWLIGRQAYHDKASGQVFVAWSCGGQSIPDPFANTLALFGAADEASPPAQDTDAGQAFAIHLKHAIAGYRAHLDPTEDIMVLGLDSATPGRMVITFYRELKGSEFLSRIEAWHKKIAWHQNFSKDNKFIGAPSPRDIAEAAFGRRLDDKLRKATIERLLPCIVDQQPIPHDLIISTTRRTSNRVGLDAWEFEKCLGIACALFKGHHTERNYQMALETDRTTRDYLYGCLLAIAETIESRALFVAGEKRDTTAARLMQRFSDRLFSTWKTIELALAPYKSRLRTQRAGFLFEMERLLDETTAKFSGSDYTNDASLSGEFLLGYHCQRLALRKSATPDAETEPTGTDNQPKE
ncbi:MAG: type I-C CRISPR-associated protein Cas8c/Csd1 [Leptothrix sp. (in: b-proteobacteria)]